MKAKVLAFCNHKGGVGKTTSVLSIGTILAGFGKRVLLVDLDAQSNLTFSLTDLEAPERSTYTALKERGNLPQMEIAKNLYLSPASLDLAAIESEMGGTISRERALQKAIEPLRGEYEYILIDCAPSLGLLLINALTAADSVYIPLTAETLPYKGLTSLEGVIAQVKEYLNSELKIGGIFFTRWNNRSLNKEVEQAARATYGDLILQAKVRENIAIAEAPLSKQTITEYAPLSNGAADYTLLTGEIMNREHDYFIKVP
jgi:chromosome partitioning protein